MCGICGSMSSADPVADTRAMLKVLIHRGPDDEGLWLGPGIALGHRRLSIVDLSAAGHQPMVLAGGQFASTVNGEIYNYPELRADLERSGAIFRSHSDSEVVLHLYEAYGVAGFTRLNGMFAFALYDGRHRRLLLVRDRLGIKPLYYWHDSATGRLLFASEIKAILAAARRSRWTIDPVGLGQYLSIENMLGDRTLYSEIKCLPPGSRLEYDSDGLRVSTYWRPLPSDRGLSFAGAVQEFDGLFSAAVGRHLMSDVPIASYLSSGFDSTLVASEAARSGAAPPHAFTGTFGDGGWYDETGGARLVARHISAAMTSVEIGADDLVSELDNVIRALDEPRMGIGAFSQYMVAKRVARDFKAILTGHGGDELFSGYPVFKNAALIDAGGLAASVATLGSVRLTEIPHLAYFLARSMMPGAPPGELPVLFAHSRLDKILQRNALDAVSTSRDYHVLTEISETANSAYERVLLTYLSVYLPGLLVVEDKISMAHSLESRTPFLDNTVVDFALSISPRVKLSGGELKAIVKAKGRTQLPVELFELPKRGFPTPLAGWLRGPNRNWMRRRLTGADSRLEKIFQRSFIAAGVDRYLDSWRSRVRPLDEIQTHRMWMMLSLESWLRQSEECYGVELTL